MTSPDQTIAAIARGRTAAIEYARAQYAGMSGTLPAHVARAAQLAAEIEHERGQIELTSGMAQVLLRLAQLHADATMCSVGDVLDSLQAELTPH